MQILLEKSKYLILVTSLFSFAASIAGFIWDEIKTSYFIASIFKVANIDIFSLIYSVEIAEIFLLTDRKLHDLKSKLGSIVPLMMAVAFLKHIVEGKNLEGKMFFKN